MGTRSEVAVVGMAGRFPGARTTDQLWDLLAAGRDAVGEIPAARWCAEDGGAAGQGPRWAGLLDSLENFDHRFFGISPREAQAMDPQQRMLLEETWRCVEDAALPLALLRSRRCAVFVGAMTSDHLQRVAAPGQAVDSYSALGAYHGLIANRISHFFGFTGQSLAVDASHAASFVALQLAVRALQAGDCDFAVVAGVNAILDPWKHLSFSKARMLSPTGRCRVFDAAADGYVPGEGGAVVLLQRLPQALRDGSRVHGVIKGIAVNHCGSTESLTAPSMAAQSAVLRQALREARVAPASVSYIEAHGTGTPRGDPVEVAALDAVYGRVDNAGPCLLGSVKSNVGHLEAASGITGLIKVLLMMRHRQVPPTLHVTRLNPAFALDGSRLRVATEALPWEAAHDGAPLRAGVSSFGFGGVNAHLVLQAPAAPPRARAHAGPAALPFVLSAASAPALARLRESWASLARETSFVALSLADVCGSMLFGRAPLAHRWGVRVDNMAQLAAALAEQPATAGAGAPPAAHDAALSAWLGGAATDWNAALPVFGFRRIGLPLYPFEAAAQPPVALAGAPVPAAGVAPAGGLLAAAAVAYLTRTLAELLRCSPEAVGSDDLFSDALGVDSFVNMELIERLQLLTGALPRTLLFEYTTVRRLVAYLVANHGVALAAGLARAGVAPQTAPQAVLQAAPPAAPQAPPQTAAAAPAAGAGARDVAIIGMAGRFPGAPSVDALWDLLAAGRSSIGPVPPARWDARATVDPSGRDPGRSYTGFGGFLEEHDCFDAPFFHIAPRQAALMDPQQRIFLETVWAAMEDAAYRPDTLPARTGVFAGASGNSYALWAAADTGAGAVLTPETDLSDIANRVSYFLDLKGPSMTVDTACSASLSALHVALQALAAGDCDAAFVGGVNLTLHPNRVLQFCRKEMLQRGPDCHPFGAGAAGFVDGEGVCAVLLKPLAQALRDQDIIHGVLKGSAVNSGGRTSGYTVPSPVAQANMVREALQRSGIDAASISYVEAHGTGTRLGDPIEVEGLTRAFGWNPQQPAHCALGSLKGNIGHLNAAAGLAGLLKVLLQMRHRMLAPSINAAELNPFIAFEQTPFRVQQALAPWQAGPGPLRAGVSSFGSGGSNAHVIVEQAPACARAPAAAPAAQLFPLSARSAERLSEVARRLAAHLRGQQEAGRSPALGDVALTLREGRVALPVRALLAAADLDALTGALDALVADAPLPAGCWCAGMAPPDAVAADAAAQRWIDGAAAHWGGVGADAARRIALPAYPFVRTRHWLPLGAPAATHTAARDAMSTAAPGATDMATTRAAVFCREQWQIAAAPALRPAATDADCLVFAADGQARPPGRTELAWVRLGQAWKAGQGAWHVDAARADDYARLFESLREAGLQPRHLVWLAPSAPMPTLAEPPEAGLHAFYLMCRALVRHAPGAALSLTFVYPGWAGYGHPQHAAVGAFLRALQGEHPQLATRCVEWDTQMPGWSKLAAADALALALRELACAGPADAVVRYGLGQRWVKRLAALALAPGRGHVCGSADVILISGGLGGIGLALATRLARAGCRLALVGRRPPTAVALETIARMQALGAAVMTIEADVGRRDGAEAAVGAARARFGALTGVVHAAGIKHSGIVYGKDWSEVLPVLSSKVAGALHLDAATRAEPLAFFSLFSSVACLMHAEGLADYAYANSFLDHFADWRQNQHEAGACAGFTQSVNWPLWGGAGMTIPDAVAEDMLRASGLAPMPLAEGLVVWERALASGETRCVVLYGDAARLAHLSGPGTAPPATAAPAQAPQPLSAAPVSWAPTAAAQDTGARCAHWLRACVSEITGTAAADIAGPASLADYGLDSVGMRQLIGRLETLTGALPMSLLLEYPSVDALAGYLLAHRAAALAGLPAGAKELAAAHGAHAQVAVAAPAAAARAAGEGATAATAATAAAAAAPPGAALDIAIVGFSGRFPGAPNVDAFWENLATGKVSTGPVPAQRWDAAVHADAGAASAPIYCKHGGFIDDVDRFDPLLFELTPAEARTMHPEERLLLESAWSTLESAGYTRAQVRGCEIGVFIGANALTYPLLSMEAWGASHDVGLDGSYAGLANRISYFFDLRGPSIALDSACSSSLVALHQACESLRAGGCTAALVGGVNLYLHPSKYWLLCRQRLATAQQRFRLFEREGDGTLPGEGVASLLLKPLKQALADGDVIHGVIKGSAVAHKGRSNGYMAPSPAASVALYRQALRHAGLAAADIDYLELQSAGSAMADSAEWRALAEVYGQPSSRARMLGSLKPNIGHLEAASGVAQVIKVLLQMRHGRVPPALVASERNPDIAAVAPLQLVEHLCAWPAQPVRRAAVSAAGAGGTLAHLILEQYAGPAPAAAPCAPGAPQVLVLSARSAASLRAMAAALREHLLAGFHHAGAQAPTLAALAHTLQTRRAVFDCRLALVAADEAQLLGALARYLGGGEGEAVFTGVAGEAPAPAGIGAGDVTQAARLWCAGSTVDWGRLMGRDASAIAPVWLPGYAFERKRCWINDEEEPIMGLERNSTDGQADVGCQDGKPLSDAAAYVANYYNRMTDSLKAMTLSVEDEMYILFAPFPEKVAGFSWLKAFFDPSTGRQHLDLMLAKQKELKGALYRHVDFAKVGRVFDIGCGLATDLIQLARAHPHLSAEGFTITPRQAETGAERIVRAGLEPRVCVHCADSTERPFGGKYDLIIGFEVIFHIENKHAVFANIASHLADDGYVILADGVTNTVTEVNMPHLGQFTATSPQFAQVLADNGLMVEDCIDTSREISNFLYDGQFEQNLATINALYPSLAEVEAEHRCWDSFGKVLGMGIVRYLLFTIRKAPAGLAGAALARLNEERIDAASPYALYAAALAAPAQQPAPLPMAPAAAASLEALVGLAAGVWEMAPESIPRGAPFTEYGVGSLQGLQLVEAANRRFGLRLKMSALYEYSNLRALSGHIDAVLDAAAVTRVPVSASAPVAAAAATPVAAAAPAATAPAAPAPLDEPIAVVGMGARFPGAPDLDSFWHNLAHGVDSVTPLAPERRRGGTGAHYFAGQIADVDCFDAAFFHLSPREVQLMDPQQRLFLEICWHALEDACYPAESLDGKRCGVFAGVMGSDYRTLLEAADVAPEAQALLGNDDAVLAARIAYFLNLKGPALTLKTACSSSLLAVHLACQSLRSGECELALAGGVTLYLDDRPFEMMERAGMLSPGGRCRPFDDGADGIAVGDGVGVVVLKRLAQALADGDRIHGVIRGSASNQNGRGNGITAPGKAAQKALTLGVLERAGVHPDAIDYVEAHGTGTSLGDPIEFDALTEAFASRSARRGYCALGSVKGNIGHTTAASGVAGLIKVLLCLQHGIIAPSLHMRTPNRHIDFVRSAFFVNTALRGWARHPERPRLACVSAFGYSGTNCHMLVEEAPALPAPPAAPAPHAPSPVQVVVLSARTPQRLQAYARSLLARLTGPGGAGLALADVAHTLQSGRSAMAERAAMLVHDHAALQLALAALADGSAAAGVWRGTVADSMAGSAAASMTAPVITSLATSDAMAPAVSAAVAAAADAAAPEELALAWVGGQAVDWRRLHGGAKPRLLGLPGYPFARERYWIPAAAPAAAPARDGQLSLLQPLWQAVHGAEQPWSGAIWLVDHAPRWQDALDAAADGAFGYALVADVLAESVAGELSFTPTPAAHAAVAVVVVEGALAGPGQHADELARFMALAADLLRRPGGAPRALIHLALRPEAAGSPVTSALAAFARSLARETTRLRVQALTVDSSEAVPAAVRAALADGGPQLDWRGGQLRAAGLAALAPACADAPGLRQGAVVVISGGAGGIGRLFACDLAARFKVRLVLCGRSAPAAAAACIAEVERLGGTAVYVQADVSDAAAVADLLGQARRRFGGVHGIVHAAGVIDDAMFEGKAAPRRAAVLAPKVAGALNLDHASRTDALELFVLVSSVAAVTGNAGQTDYACANGFLDGFAEWRQAHRPGRTLAVNWPWWADGGMRVSAAGAQLLESELGLRPMPDQAGLEAWHTLLGAGYGPRAVVAYGDGARFLRAAQTPPAAPAVPWAEPAATAAFAPAVAAPAQLATAALDYFRRFFAEHLKTTLAQIDPDARFDSFGMDSLMIHSFNERMQRELGAFPRTLLFDHHTLRALSAYFVASHGPQLAAALASPLAAPGAAPAAAPATAAAAPAAAADANVGVGDIAIIGISGRYPQAPDLAAFWDNLRQGRDCVGAWPAARWGAAGAVGAIECRVGGYLEQVDRFDALFFGIAQREAERMDPHERLFLETAWATLEDAAYPPQRLAHERAARGREVGVFAGVTGSAYALWGPALWREGGDAIPESMAWSVANRVSYVFDLHGPSMPVDTACSSSLTAVHLACDSLRKGECAMALAGGVNLYLHPAKLAQLSQLSMLSRSGHCHSFGAGGDGFVPGEGVGAVLLKPLAAALADGDAIHAVIKGSAINHGGRTNGYTVPSSLSQSALVKQALRAAGVDAASIGCVEAHGTGTALGDPLEVAGLAAAFDGVGAGRCALGSVKSNIGHLEGAAGIAGLTKVVLQLRHRSLAPTLHAAQPNPAIAFDATPLRLQQTLADWPLAPGQLVRRAGVSAFGAGGANAHVVLEEAPAPAPRAHAHGPHLFLLSARSEADLLAMAARLRAHLERAPQTLAAVAFTLALGREPLAERLALVAGDLGELCAGLRAFELGAAVRHRGRIPTAAAKRVVLPSAQLAALLAAGELAPLAAAWIGGAVIDWAPLWPEAHPLPVSLPAYPFDGRRCWAGDEAPAAPVQPAEAATLAPPELMDLLRGVARGEVALDDARRGIGALAQPAGPLA